MAYFRCGGGGIPSSLRSGMNDVLNKKFGTSTIYPPTGWPDDINLMGPLEEKTVSGAIATCPDGADDVPCKSVKCSVIPSGGNGTPSSPVPIVGASSITVSQRGKNLLPCGDEDEETISQVNFSTDGEGRFTVSGTATGSAATFYSDLNNSYTIKSGDYLHIMNSAGVATASLALRDANGVIVSRALNPVNRIIDLSEFVGKTVTQISVYLSNGTTYNGTITPMIIHGATSTAFEPYNAIADVTAQIGQTVYGGEYDFNTGVFTATHEILTLDGSEDWQRSGTYNGSFYYDTETNHIFSSGNSLCSHLVQAYPFPSNYASGKFGLNGANFQILNIWIMPANSTVEELETYLQTQYNNGTPVQVALELATPVEITGLDTHTFETVLGSNNFYCDLGDTEVVYRSSGTVYQYTEAEGETF